jgi:hypothetical protein
MLKNKTINMGVVKKVATALGELITKLLMSGAQRSVYMPTTQLQMMFVPRKILISSFKLFHSVNLQPYRTIWPRKAYFRIRRQKSIADLNTTTC